HRLAVTLDPCHGLRLVGVYARTPRRQAALAEPGTPPSGSKLALVGDHRLGRAVERNIRVRPNATECTPGGRRREQVSPSEGTVSPLTGRGRKGRRARPPATCFREYIWLPAGERDVLPDFQPQRAWWLLVWVGARRRVRRVMRALLRLPGDRK